MNSTDLKIISQYQISYSELESLKSLLKTQSQIFDGLDLILCQITTSDDNSFILSLIEQIRNKTDEF